MRRILKYVRPHIVIMLVGLTVKILGSLAELIIPRIMTYIITNIVPLQEIRPIVIWGAVMVLSAVLCVVLNVTANRMAAKVSRNIAEDTQRPVQKNHEPFRRADR